MSKELDIELTFTPVTMDIDIIMSEVSSKLTEITFSCTEEFCFAIREALINSIEACKGLDQQNQMIFIHLQYTDGTAIAEISDLGKPFDESRLNYSKEMSFEDVLHEEDGRGFLFIELFTDDFYFTQNYEGLKTFVLKRKG
ncbi:MULTISPECIES: ATP-binding protein [Bacillaceae]|uniref:ATP-binding protein n=1 Tax=Bacillaceae TaxID=186817 RepID=UPI0004791A21|nr:MULTISPECIES: ATP-binding protein [Bacillaceae]UOE92510.1 ATP-binding protein [Alkalihalobacillus sp. LMS39]